MKYIFILLFLFIGVCSAQTSSRLITIDSGTTLPDYTTVDDAVFCYVKANGNLYFNRKTSGVGWSLIKTSDPTVIQQDATHRFVTDSQISAWNAGGGGGTETFFELDVNSDIMPKTTLTTDTFFELDSNTDIEPK